MKKLLTILAFVSVAFAQTAKFPGAIATDQDLLKAKDRSRSYLTAQISAEAMTVPVVDGTRFAPYQSVTITDEQILVCEVNGNTLNVCTGGRGFGGTTPAAHATGLPVEGRMTAWHHNAAAAEIKAIEAALGVNLGNVSLPGHAHAGSDITTGTVAETRIDAALARDSEINVQGTANEIASTGGGVAPVLSIAPTFDISGKTSTKPVKSGTTPPGTCAVGELFYDTDATAGQNLYGCTAVNTWTLLGDGGGGGAVNSVFGRTGDVVATDGDYAGTTNTYTAGKKQIFQASTTTAGAGIACAALPSTPATGDVACDSADGNKLKQWNGSAWVDLTASGGDITAVGNCATGDCFQAAAQNSVLAGLATGGAGQASMRALVAADIPSLPASKITSGTLSTVPIQDKGGAVYNVKAYGAVGDGATDDAAAIQAAINAIGSGGTVFVPPGTYMLATAAIKLRPNVSVICANGAIIKQSNAADLATLLDFDTYSATNAQVTDCIFDGNRTNNTEGYVYSLASTAQSRSQFINNIFQNAPGIALDLHGSDCIVERNKFSSIRENAVWMTDASAYGIGRCLIHNNHFERIGLHPIGVYWKSANRIVHNIILGTRVVGHVTTNGTTVSWVSGETFTSLLGGMIMRIVGTEYQIASVTSPTALLLTSTAGVQTDVAQVAGTGDLINIDSASQTIIESNVGVYGMSGGVVIHETRGTTGTAQTIINANVMTHMGGSCIAVMSLVPGGAIINSTIITANQLGDCGAGGTANPSGTNNGIYIVGTEVGRISVNGNRSTSYGGTQEYGIYIDATVTPGAVVQWDNESWGDTTAPQYGATFANLGTQTWETQNGRMTYCTDCTIANPCAGSGTGALAKRLNGVWVCN